MQKNLERQIAWEKEKGRNLFDTEQIVDSWKNQFLAYLRELSDTEKVEFYRNLARAYKTKDPNLVPKIVKSIEGNENITWQVVLSAAFHHRNFFLLPAEARSQILFDIFPSDHKAQLLQMTGKLHIDHPVLELEESPELIHTISRFDLHPLSYYLAQQVYADLSTYLHLATRAYYRYSFQRIVQLGIAYGFFDRFPDSIIYRRILSPFIREDDPPYIQDLLLPPDEFVDSLPLTHLKKHWNEKTQTFYKARIKRRGSSKQHAAANLVMASRTNNLAFTYRHLTQEQTVADVLYQQAVKNFRLSTRQTLAAQFPGNKIIQERISSEQFRFVRKGTLQSLLQYIETNKHFLTHESIQELLPQIASDLDRILKKEQNRSFSDIYRWLYEKKRAVPLEYVTLVHSLCWAGLTEHQEEYSSSQSLEILKLWREKLAALLLKHHDIPPEPPPPPLANFSPLTAETDVPWRALYRTARNKVSSLPEEKGFISFDHPALHMILDQRARFLLSLEPTLTPKRLTVLNDPLRRKLESLFAFTIYANGFTVLAGASIANYVHLEKPGAERLNLFLSTYLPAALFFLSCNIVYTKFPYTEVRTAQFEPNFKSTVEGSVEEAITIRKKELRSQLKFALAYVLLYALISFFPTAREFWDEHDLDKRVQDATAQLAQVVAETLDRFTPDDIDKDNQELNQAAIKETGTPVMKATIIPELSDSGTATLAPTQEGADLTATSITEKVSATQTAFATSIPRDIDVTATVLAQTGTPFADEQESPNATMTETEAPLPTLSPETNSNLNGLNYESGDVKPRNSETIPNPHNFRYEIEYTGQAPVFFLGQSCQIPPDPNLNGCFTREKGDYTDYILDTSDIIKTNSEEEFASIKKQFVANDHLILTPRSFTRFIEVPIGFELEKVVVLNEAAPIQASWHPFGGVQLSATAERVMFIYKALPNSDQIAIPKEPLNLHTYDLIPDIEYLEDFAGKDILVQSVETARQNKRQNVATRDTFIELYNFLRSHGLNYEFTQFNPDIYPTNAKIAGALLQEKGLICNQSSWQILLTAQEGGYSNLLLIRGYANREGKTSGLVAADFDAHQVIAYLDEEKGYWTFFDATLPGSVDVPRMIEEYEEQRLTQTPTPTVIVTPSPSLTSSPTPEPVTLPAQKETSQPPWAAILSAVAGTLGVSWLYRRWKKKRKQTPDTLTPPSSPMAKAKRTEEELRRLEEERKRQEQLTSIRKKVSPTVSRYFMYILDYYKKQSELFFTKGVTEQPTLTATHSWTRMTERLAQDMMHEIATASTQHSYFQQSEFPSKLEQYLRNQLQYNLPLSQEYWDSFFNTSLQQQGEPKTLTDAQKKQHSIDQIEKAIEGIDQLVSWFPAQTQRSAELHEAARMFETLVRSLEEYKSSLRTA